MDGHTADWVIVVARSEEGVRSYLLDARRRGRRHVELVPSLDPTRKLARLRPRRDAGRPARAAGQPGPPVAAGAGRHRRSAWPPRRSARPTAPWPRRSPTPPSASSSTSRWRRTRSMRHRLVEMFQQVEMARAGFQFAAWASDTEAPEREQAAAMAASYAAEAGRPGHRRRHPAARRRGLHLGQRRPLPLQAGEAERSPVRRRRRTAAPAGVDLHRVGLSRSGGRHVSSCARCRPIWPSATWPRARGTTARSGSSCDDALLTEDPTRRFRIWSPTNPYIGTVGEVYEEALRVAGGLRELGLGPGDLVAFQLPNWVEAAITFYACTMLGVTLVPIVHFYGPKEVGFILRQSGARALVIVSSYRQARLPGRAGHHPRRPRRPRAWSSSSATPGDAPDLVAPSTSCATPSRWTARSPSTPTAPPSSATPRARRPTPRVSCTRTAPSAARCAS